MYIMSYIQDKDDNQLYTCQCLCQNPAFLEIEKGVGGLHPTHIFNRLNQTWILSILINMHADFSSVSGVFFTLLKSFE